MSALAKILVLVVTMTPFVFLADCVYQEIALGRSLQHLCVSTEPESKLSDALARAEALKLDLRTGLAALDDSDWFDREYARIVAWHKQSEPPSSSEVAVVFSKPGMGYYACVIAHQGDAVVDAEFVDRSS